MSVKKEIKELYKDCEIKSGKGSFKADLMIIYKGPDFKNAKLLKQMIAELKINNKNIYATPIRKGAKNKQDLKDRLDAEIALISPNIIWVIGNKASKLIGIDMPMHIGYARYFPYNFSDFFAFLMPTQKMINKMPNKVKKKFWKRLSLFQAEWKENVFPDIPKNRRSDIQFVKNFAKDNDYEFDKQLKGPNTYYWLFSNKVGSHIFVLPTFETKKDFEDNIPFGLKFTQDDVKDMNQDEANKLARIMKLYDGKTVQANLNVL